MRLKISYSCSLILLSAALQGCGVAQKSPSFEAEEAEKRPKDACPTGLSTIIKEKLSSFERYDEAAFQWSQALGAKAKASRADLATQAFADVRHSCDALRKDFASSTLECVYTDLSPVQRAIFGARTPRINIAKQLQSCVDIEKKFLETFPK